VKYKKSHKIKDVIFLKFLISLVIFSNLIKYNNINQINIKKITEKLKEKEKN